jgi:hypothetical protein
MRQSIGEHIPTDPGCNRTTVIALKKKFECSVTASDLFSDVYELHEPILRVEMATGIFCGFPALFFPGDQFRSRFCSTGCQGLAGPVESLSRTNPMKNLHTVYIASALSLLVGAMAADPAHAASDRKSFSAARCQSMVANGTADGELQTNHNGIYNPGTSAEWVMCELPIDSETQWAATPGSSGTVNVYYETGSVSGRVLCNMFVGSNAMQATPLYSYSASPSRSDPYTRSYLSLSLSYPSTDPGFTLVPVNLECMLTPKTTLAGFYFNETVPTDTP